MRKVRRSLLPGLAAILLAGQALAEPPQPSVWATGRDGSAQTPAAVTVEASDSEGLDSLEIRCQEIDSAYHTQLSGASVNHSFKRSFTIPELFPDVGGSRDSLRLEVVVRNTRGAKT